MSVSSNSQQVVGQGIFASSSLATLRMRKEIELWELCHTTLPKVPRAYSKVCKIQNTVDSVMKGSSAIPLENVKGQ